MPYKSEGAARSAAVNLWETVRTMLGGMKEDRELPKSTKELLRGTPPA